VLKTLRNLIKDLYKAYRKWQEDNGSHMAASVSFYLAVSFFPLLLVLISGSGLILRFTGWGQNASQRLIDLIAEQTAPELTKNLELVLSNVQNDAIINEPIGLVSLLFGAMIVFINFDNAMNLIWNVPQPRKKGFLAAIRNLLINRMRAFLMLLGIGIFAVGGFVISMSLSVAEKYVNEASQSLLLQWNLITPLAALVLNWLLFTLVYKVLPKVPVRWRDAGRGALFATIMWEIGRHVLAVAVIGSKFSVYGIVGAFVAIMLWTFYAVSILFLGAEYIQVFCMRRNSK
jgi:membrane protein